MAKKDNAFQKWQSIYDEMTALEESILRAQVTVTKLKSAEHDHIMTIAVGNVRKVRTFLIQNQSKILYLFRVKTKEKGGESVAVKG